MEANIAFFQFSQAQLAQIFSTGGSPTLGSCLTGVVAGRKSGTPPVATYLNGGTSVTLTPPSGSQVPFPSQTQGAMLNDVHRGHGRRHLLAFVASQKH